MSNTSNPVFNSAADQLLYYLNKYIVFCLSVFRTVSKREIPPDNEVLEKLNLLPRSYLLGMAMDIKEKFGAELDKEDVSAISKAVACFNPFKDDLTEDVTLFNDKLGEDKAKQRRFFLYWKVISRILN